MFYKDRHFAGNMYKTIKVPQLRQYAVIITVNLLTLCVGINIGWSSPVLVKLRDPKQSPLSRPITEDEGGWIVSIGYVFAIFTLPFIWLLVDKIGRRYTIIITCLPKIISDVIAIFATEVWMLLMARVLNGIVNMAALMLITVYATEISSKEIRGSLGLVLSIFSNLGILIMLGIGPYITYHTLSITMAAISIFVSIPMTFIPDTPYSLYNKGKIEEAKKVLVYFRGSEAVAEEELKELAETKPDQKLVLRDILKNKVYMKSLLIAVVMGLGLQLVGFNFISFYLQTILEISNTSVSPALGSVIIGVTQIMSSIVAGLVIDRFGRKPMLIVTLLTLALGMIGLGTFFTIREHGVFINGFLNYLPLICIAVLTCSYSGGIGSLYFVVISELLDGPIRALGNALAGVVCNLVMFLLTRYTMNILLMMGPDCTFIMFGILSIVMSFFIIFFVPETKQKSITEIQRALGGWKKVGETKDCLSRF